MGEISTLGSFDSAPLSHMSGDKSVRRSAQDDGLVGVVMKTAQIG